MMDMVSRRGQRVRRAPRYNLRVSILIEAAVTSPRDAAAAQLAGADRVELCCALELGGLTPSPALLDTTLEATTLPVIALLRPRPGGFTYDEHDVALIARDAAEMIRRGAAGVAFGCLTADRRVHRDHTARIADAARQAQGPRPVGSTAPQLVFHRAFDVTADPFAALDTLIGLRLTRVLTSGQQPTARAGADLIARLITRAAGRIEILPAAGVNEQTAADLVIRTGCTQIHGSFSAEHTDPAAPVCPGACRRLDADHLRRVRRRFPASIST